jgi:hypothetical protein
VSPRQVLAYALTLEAVLDPWRNCKRAPRASAESMRRHLLVMLWIRIATTTPIDPTTPCRQGKISIARGGSYDERTQLAWN